MESVLLMYLLKKQELGKNGTKIYETIKKYEDLTSDGVLILRLKRKSERKLTQDLKIAFQNAKKNK